MQKLLTKILKPPGVKLLFILLLSLLLFSISTKTSQAASGSAVAPAPYSSGNNPIPDPYVPCGETRDNEFNSLRPYQSSPCNIPIKEEEQALLCGNDLIVNDIIYIPQDPYDVVESVGCTPECPGNSCGPIKCWVKAERNFTIAFDAFGSELPIAGNTEEVAGNSDWPSIIDSLLELTTLRKDWRLKTESNQEGFSDHLPPDPIIYPDFRSFYIAYQEWRGKECIETPKEIELPVIGTIKLPGVLICYDSPLNPNFWATLFPKVPYSSTEDRIGKANVTDMVWVPGKSSVKEVKNLDTGWNPKKPVYGLDPGIAENEVPLYFPHMEENVELTTLLQSTYLPKDLQQIKASSGPNLQPSPEPNADCKIVNVRYNPGDQLFGERKEGTTGLGQPNAKVTYDAYFWCEGECIHPIPENGCATRKLNCIKNAWFYSDVTIYTPMIDELYERTVSNESSVFRRMLPRTGENTPTENIEDIPAVTSVQHFAEDNITKSPPIQLISDPAEFYIPHFGSIYDYLLHDMQTALRPKGFPGRPAGLIDEKRIPEIDTVNEYLSWYLNGTINRAEDGPLKTSNEEDQKRIINLAGPINKLLARDSQWRNIFGIPSTSTGADDQSMISRVNTTFRAKVNRHNQIAGCSLSIEFTIPIIGKTIHLGGFPAPCQTESQKNLPPEAEPPSGGPEPPAGCDICEIANEYNVPCCFLKGIWDIETGQSKNMPTGTYGNLQCCNSIGACGPMQIMGGLLPPLSAGKQFDLCDECDSWELAARLLVLKKCVAAGECNSWEWIEGLQNKYPVMPNELEVVGYYYGTQGCFPDNATQCRWGDGISYCDAVNSWCTNNTSTPENCTQQYCSQLTPPITCP